MKTTSTFGQWLKQRRHELDLTQDAIADSVGCSTDTIYKIEAGLRRPSRQVAELLAGCLQVSPNERPAFVKWARGASIEQPSVAVEKGTSDGFLVGSASTMRSNTLPVAPTHLIGREQEIARLRELLWHNKTRILTLVGPPGIGKTRLAQELAATLQDDFKDGMAYIPLASVLDPELLPATLAAGLGIKESSKHSLIETLQDTLRDKQLLLVLDNFEQIAEAAGVVTSLLSVAPQLKVLVTSRTPLHLRGEKLLSVPPLALPDLQHMPAYNELAEIEAVALFVERAQDAQNNFELTSENAALVAAICNQLDGIPLAIELAAAKIRLLSLPQLLARLEHRLSILTGGPRDAPMHQQTLRQSIESSYMLMNSDGQKLFRQLGIFLGPFTLEAAEEVTDTDIEGMEAILDQSLLRRQADGVMVGDGEALFSMLSSIREYAREKLDAQGETDSTALKHTRYYLKLVLAAEPELSTANQKLWVNRLAASYADIRAAFNWSLKNGEIALALHMAGTLWRYWYVTGEFSDGRRWLELALGCGSDQPPEMRALVLHGIGTLAERQNDLAAAESYLLESIAIRQHSGNKHALANTLNSIGTVYYSQGSAEKAETAYRQALALHEELGEKEDMARIQGNLAMVYYSRGEYERASAILEETLAMRRELRFQVHIASALNNLALLMLLLGDYERSLTYSEDAVALDFELGDQMGRAFSLGNLGHAARRLGQYERAQSALAESFLLFTNMGDKRNQAASLLRLAAVAVWSGKPARAARLYGVAEAVREAVDIEVDTAELADYQESLALTRDKLSQVELNAAWSVGRAMKSDEARALALDGEDIDAYDRRA
ncbi:MAG: tetratricopeptide repeat protein [Chloroflexia bacterium]